MALAGTRYEPRLTSAAQHRADRQHANLRSDGYASLDIVDSANKRVMQSFQIVPAMASGTLKQRILQDLDSLTVEQFEKAYGIDPTLDIFTREAMNPPPTFWDEALNHPWRTLVVLTLLILVVVAVFAFGALVLQSGVL
jgi:hypothetical protein